MIDSGSKNLKGQAMTSVNSAIKIFCRVKPIPDPVVGYDVLTADNSSEEMLQLSLREEHPATTTQLYLNNKPEQYKFRFTKVFDRTSRQDYIFNEVARPVIDSALQGYNGTIFAYGQTGTGKTYTMTGSRTSFGERGIIPRTLEYIFQKFQEDNNPSKVRNVFVSYLEIYNEAGYDLLNPSTMTGRMDDLGRVSLMEDGSQQMHLRNLSVHSIESVEEATQFLYLGDHNRTIAETPLNEVSTRSHCIFTVHLNMRDVNTSLATRSKLHLVDLAGSERVSTISTTSQLATEARHINLALHYLEQVIVALGDSNRTHIPYRNSMMTSVLRDSLGGNCMTSMIATISLDPRNTQETLSTCRFAQRVAMVTNAVQRNEDLDPTIIITQLKSEVKKLREIIESNSCKPVKENTGPLTEDEFAVCAFGVQQFLSEGDTNNMLSIPHDMRMIQECFRILKSHVLSKGAAECCLPSTPSVCSAVGGAAAEEALPNDRNLSSLAQLVARRDAEIKVLMDMIRKEKTKRSATATPLSGKPSLEAIPAIKFHPLPLHQSSRANSVASMGKYRNSVSPEQQSRDSAEQDNSFDDTPGEIPDLLQLDSHCNTPPPSRDESLTFDETMMTQDFTATKRVALVTFVNKYEGTAALENLRSKVFEKRAEIRALENSIASYVQNTKSMKKILETTHESDSPLDLSNLSASMNNQQRTLEIQKQELEAVRDEVDQIELVLKAEYQKLLNDFEQWWSITESIGPEVEERKFQHDSPGVTSIIKKSGLEERLKEGSKGGGKPNTQIEYPPRSDSSSKSIEFSSTNGIFPPPPRSQVMGHQMQARGDTLLSEDDDDSSDDEPLAGIPVTGDIDTDQEVLQFLQARKQIFQNIKQKREEASPH